MKMRLIALMLCLTQTLYSCKDNNSLEVMAVTVSPESILLVYGGSPSEVQMKVTIMPETLKDVPVTYFCDNNKVATVSATGLVTALSVGSTNISVKAGTKTTRVSVKVVSPDEAPSGYTTSASDTWVATDALGREIGTQNDYGMRNEGKVGIFYFIWIGAHGYDTHEDHQEVQRPKATDVNSPYDISKLLKANPTDPQYGPRHAFHHWGEPHFNYYVSNDEWVIEKHAQLLADAGVDVMFFDVTNALPYVPTVKVVCNVLTRMRAQGRTTPQIAFLLHSNSAATLQALYDNIYKQGLYRDLWFEWKDKPLALCPKDGLSSECLNFFTLRDSWFNTRDSWFTSVSGKDKWAWADFYPQNYGWHESASKPEQISVAVATHPTSNIGRSYSNGSQPTVFQSEKGLFFAEQWKRALDVKPEFVFVTGWNEWIAMRFLYGPNMDNGTNQMIGKTLPDGGSYFVDQYNEEYSRDIEPLRGGFGDNYYYQLVDNIRRYKGVQALPVANGAHTPLIDGNAGDWADVLPVFADDPNDITARNHYGYGRIGTLTNNDGRNDFITAKAATDATNAYFCMKTAAPVVTGERPLQLFIKADSSANSWEGFQYRIDVTDGNSALYASTGGWNWQKKADVPCKISGAFIELSVPLSTLGLSSGATTLDFKWADNMLQNGDIRDFMDHGDTAPNSRFRYRYIR